MPAAGLLPDAHLPLHAYSIETLGLTCSIKSAPTLLSPFKHISNLAIACPDGLDTDAVQVSSTREPIEVESICSLCWDAPALSLLQGVVDFQTVRRLMISEAPSVTEPALGYLIQAMPSLESLCYLSVDSSAAPFDTPGCLRLRYVGVGGHVFALAVEPGEKQEDVTEDGIEGDAEAGTLCVENGADGDDGKVADEGRRTLGNGDATEIGDEDANTIQGGGLEYCDWEYILRDLYILVTDVTEEITIVLDIEETYNSEDASEPDDVKDIARALWKAFSLLDWDGLHTVVRKCSNLRTLRISIEYGGLIEPEECGEILRKVLSKYLPKAIVAKTTVNTA
ncbi:hypothetical protein PsYK624_130880 [Phanerochaete sordida]|uniref:F-box domain-containing protein n=1 Tax=Phanerochaete sordida TaxID=48140 RepID=A0A9P3LJ00_9APHY|nr:hypothetical protein PsYK624_130880 [Phanerochaete sordida]